MNQENAIIYLLGYGIGIVIVIFVTRLIFSIPTFLKYQRMQVLLLAELAKIQGVDTERIEKIKNDKVLL
ncbi:MAG: hypothetical protein ACHQIM_11970 [Sphingobacteriales bacterium]